MKLLVSVLVLFVATSALALEHKEARMQDDFGTQPLYDYILQYYYYIPCPTYSWFWAMYRWDPGDIIGVDFRVGDMPTGGYRPADPFNTMHLEIFRVLDFAGYGTVYPGLYTVEFDVYCVDTCGCVISPSLWNSGPSETRYGWNLIYIDPPLELCPCTIRPGFAPKFALTAKMIGSDATYPMWGFDNISTPIQQGCQMHDIGCLPASYPRWHVKTGYYGNGSIQNCPPVPFEEPGGPQYGYIELAWRVYLKTMGPTKAEETTWGSVKSLYR